jgi:flagellar assembly protein FliH
MSRDFSRVIPAEQLVHIEDWHMPQVDESNEGTLNVHAGPVTAQQIEEIQQQAYAEGFQQGLADGSQQAQQQIAQRVAELEALMQTLAQPLAQLDQEVEQQLVDLALTVAKQLIRRELKTEPGEVLAVIREALAVLPLAAQNVRLYLNPEDAELVRSTLSVGEQEQSWQIMEDPVMSRGGCRVTTEQSQIDATLENRLNAVIAQTLGGLRQSDSEGDA